MVLFAAENNLINVIVAIICVLALALVLIFILRDIKRSKAKSDDALTDVVESGTITNCSISDGSYASAVVNKNKGKDKKKSKHVDNAHTIEDPVIKILGFDPYAPVETESCEITETYYDEAHETEDMHNLRGKMRAARDIESKVKTLSARRDKVNYEMEKITRFIRDNKVVISTSQAAKEKLSAELAALSADKKTKKANKQSIAKIKNELESNAIATDALIKSVETRESEEKLLKAAFNYLESEIAKANRELLFINSDIDKLNESVGAELKKIENDNRARSLMSKYGELKPLLTDANRIYREIVKKDIELNDIGSNKHEIKAKLDAAMSELKLSVGAQEIQLSTHSISELNKKLMALNAKEEELITSKEEQLARYAVAKRKANDFLDAEKYELDDIIVAEDKVVGELEYEQLKFEYEQRKLDAKNVYDAVQKKSDALARKKVKFNKKQQEQKRAYEDEVAAVSTELRIARADYEKAVSDCDRILPSLSPSSLIESGSGVISKERISKKAALDKSERNQLDSDRARRTADSIVAEKSAEQVNNDELVVETNRHPITVELDSANLPSRPSSDELRDLMNRLNELECIALKKKEQRAAMRVEDSLTNSTNKVERKKAQIVAMRKNLKYIDSPQAAKEFKQRLYKLSISLDEDEMNDNVLAEMIRKTMNDATILGERASMQNNATTKRY